VNINDLPRPPAGLSKRSRLLWNFLVAHKARSFGRLSLIEQALRALDRAEECRKAVDREGITATTKTTGAIHVHPMLKAEKEFRAQFIAAWTRLGLAFDYDVDSPECIRWADSQAAEHEDEQADEQDENEND